MPEIHGIRRWFLRRWYGGEAPAWLAPLALGFAALSGLRRLAYLHGLLASAHPGVPVIVVGNLTAGGTGKTPLVLWLVQQLQQRGLRVGVVLRGYGGSATGPRIVNAGSDPAVVGDEAVLIAGRADCLVAIGRRRAAAAALLASSGCQVVLSDDGLQHPALRRDLEIVVIDGMRGFGNGALLPQGPLRERPGRLRSVAAVVINGSDATGVAAGIRAPFSMAIVPDGLFRLASGSPIPLDCLRGAAVHAVAATGNPDRFFALLRTLGCQPVEHAFADHYALRAADLAFADQLPVVMTEKDAVKCRAFATDRMQYLKVSATLPDQDAARLLQLVQDCITTGAR
jgi:tetraacyldisaccharide 4'-kinase